MKANAPFFSQSQALLDLFTQHHEAIARVGTGLEDLLSKEFIQKQADKLPPMQENLITRFQRGWSKFNNNQLPTFAGEEDTAKQKATQAYLQLMAALAMSIEQKQGKQGTPLIDETCLTELDEGAQEIYNALIVDKESTEPGAGHYYKQYLLKPLQEYQYFVAEDFAAARLTYSSLYGKYHHQVGTEQECVRAELLSEYTQIKALMGQSNMRWLVESDGSRPSIRDLKQYESEFSTAFQDKDSAEVVAAINELRAQHREKRQEAANTLLLEDYKALLTMRGEVTEDVTLSDVPLEQALAGLKAVKTEKDALGDYLRHFKEVEQQTSLPERVTNFDAGVAIYQAQGQSREVALRTVSTIRPYELEMAKVALTQAPQVESFIAHLTTILAQGRS